MTRFYAPTLLPRSSRRVPTTPAVRPDTRLPVEDLPMRPRTETASVPTRRTLLQVATVSLGASWWLPSRWATAQDGLCRARAAAADGPSAGPWRERPGHRAGGIGSTGRCVEGICDRHVGLSRSPAIRGGRARSVSRDRRGDGDAHHHAPQAATPRNLSRRLGLHSRRDLVRLAGGRGLPAHSLTADQLGRAPAPHSGATGPASGRGSVRTSRPRGGRTSPTRQRARPPWLPPGRRRPRRRPPLVPAVPR